MWACLILGAPTFDLKAFGDGIALVDNLFQLQRNAVSIQSIITKTTESMLLKKNDDVSIVTVFQKENNYSDQLNQIIEALNRNQNTNQGFFNASAESISSTHSSSLQYLCRPSTESSDNDYMIKVIKDRQTFLCPASALSLETSSSKSEIIVLTTVLSP